MLLRLVGFHIRPYRHLLIGLVVLQVIGVIAALYLPTLNADIIDNGVVKNDTGYIMRTGGVMLAISLVQVVATVIATYLGSRTSMGVGRDIRSRVFGRVTDFSAQELARFGAPTLISRNTNDVQQVQMVTFMALTFMVTAPINMIGGLFMALHTELGLSWLVAVVVPLLAGVVTLIIRRMIPAFRRMQNSIDDVNRILREQITGIRVVRAFVREPYETKRFGGANDNLSASALSVSRNMAVMFPAIMLIFNLSSAAVLWFGAGRINSGHMQVGQLTAFIAYLMQILMAVMMASFMSMMIPRAAVSADRIGAVLDTEPTLAEAAQPRTDLARPAGVEMTDVDFAYPGAEQPVLHHISFAARPGRTTAIIGSTGAGKTTLLNLIPRLFDASDGVVAVGGVDVRDAEQETLWSRIGLVPQRPFLFSGTVASNLRYGKPDATDTELWDALRIAQAEDFVRSMPDGLDSAISQGGTNVSGGQRQRLAIARALVRRPDVYLFDDSFSALDLATDARLRAALRPVVHQACMIVVAQRVSSIADADQIIVLDDGRIVGVGTHDELIETCPTYAEIVESQRSVQEAVA